MSAPNSLTTMARACMALARDEVRSARKCQRRLLLALRAADPGRADTWRIVRGVHMQTARDYRDEALAWRTPA